MRGACPQRILRIPVKHVGRFALRAEGLRWPLRKGAGLRPPEITWVEPTYHAAHTTLTHPAYAGAYVYGRSRDETRLGPGGQLRKRRRKLPRDQQEVLIPDHHPGFTDWDTYLGGQVVLAGRGLSWTGCTIVLPGCGRRGARGSRRRSRSWDSGASPG